MGRQDFSRELDRELAAQGAGAIDGFARALDVTPTSVHRWRRGTEQPGRSRWRMIETQLAWPPGTVYELLSRPEPPSGGRGTLETLITAIERNTEALQRNTDALERDG